MLNSASQVRVIIFLRIRSFVAEGLPRLHEPEKFDVSEKNKARELRCGVREREGEKGESK